MDDVLQFGDGARLMALTASIPEKTVIALAETIPTDV